jgi:DNA polymerase
MSLVLDARQRAMLLEMGVRVTLPEQEPVPASASAPSIVAPAPKDLPVAKAPPAIAAPDGDGANDLSRISGLDWDALARTASQCQACGLCAGRKLGTLQAIGGRPARWMVVGDPPDEQEDSSGQAFVGEAGVLLGNMLKAVGAARTDKPTASVPDLEAAYVTNVSKCRPPQGRLPQAAELSQCSVYLQREIALVQPQVILSMGRFANQVLLQEHPEAAAMALGRQRATVYRYRGVPVVVTYSPQALLRHPIDKGKAWADLCMAMAL